MYMVEKQMKKWCLWGKSKWRCDAYGRKANGDMMFMGENEITKWCLWMKSTWRCDAFMG